jgi:hypothetical protein
MIFFKKRCLFSLDVRKLNRKIKKRFHSKKNKNKNKKTNTRGAAATFKSEFFTLK